MQRRRLILVALLAASCSGFHARMDPTPSCSYRADPMRDLPDGGPWRTQVAVDVVLGQRHGCALLDRDDILCWGANDLGQVPESWHHVSGTARLYTDDRSVHGLAVGGAHGCALMEGGASCWGDNSAAQLGIGHRNPVDGTAWVLGLEGASRVTTGYRHTCVIAPDGVLCWGDNSFGQLGRDDPTCCTVPSLVPGLPPDPEEIVAGGFHTCVRYPVSTEPVWCWGDDRWGALGDGVAGSWRAEPAPAIELGSYTLRQISAGAHHTCAISSGTVLCWGRNDHGELGDFAAGDSATPVRVNGIGTDRQLIEIAAGGLIESDRGETIHRSAHTCIRDSDQRLFCWGANDRGQAGTGAVERTHGVVGPTQVPGRIRYSGLATGGAFSCAVDSRYEIWCWGANDFGQLANGTDDLPAPHHAELSPVVWY